MRLFESFRAVPATGMPSEIHLPTHRGQREWFDACGFSEHVGTRKKGERAMRLMHVKEASEGKNKKIARSF